MTLLTETPQTTEHGAYIVIERQYGPHLAIGYPHTVAAETALVESDFIDGLCQEDCLDAYTVRSLDADLLADPQGLTRLTPPVETDDDEDDLDD